MAHHSITILLIVRSPKEDWFCTRASFGMLKCWMVSMRVLCRGSMGALYRLYIEP